MGREGYTLMSRRYREEFTHEEWDDRVEMFADPGGNSALRRVSKSNPRNKKCPTCGRKNALTPADVAQGYQCDSCADRDERGGY